MYSRRQFGKLALGGFSTARVFGQSSFRPTLIDGIPFGVETFSYHDLPPAGDARLIPTLIEDIKASGIAECEIMSGHVEPMGSYATGWWVATRRAPAYAKMREDARRWRLTVPMDYYRAVRKPLRRLSRRRLSLRLPVLPSLGFACLQR